MDTNNKNDIDISHYVTTIDERTEQSSSNLFEYPDSYNTTLEQKIETQTNFNYETDENDYSLNSNFVEQTNYQIKSGEGSIISQDNASAYKPINMPLIEKKIEETIEVSKQINLSARMKIVLVSFAIILCSLMFATVWNFVLAAKLNDAMMQNQVTISDLKVSIKSLTDEYNVLGDEETIREIAESSNFVESNDTNTFEILLDDMFLEPIPPEVPTNWFDDVCDFITSLFN
jgi:cell division protein FtsL